MNDYILLCYNDFSIPIPTWAKWLAWDKNGNAFVYSKKPKLNNIDWFHIRYFRILPIGSVIPPPEKGDWKDQLYYLEDLNDD